MGLKNEVLVLEAIVGVVEGVGEEEGGGEGGRGIGKAMVREEEVVVVVIRVSVNSVGGSVSGGRKSDRGP